MDSALVIKVKHGDTLRRFTAHVDENGILDLDMGALRAKILSLFKIATDADLTLTYIDEDNDVVTLVDDNDLHDATRQGINPLRINVLLNTNRAERSNTRSRRSSSPIVSPGVQHPLSHINSCVAEVLKSLPEPFCDAFSKLSHGLTAKSVPSAPVLTELVEGLLNLALSHLDPVSQCQAGASSTTQSTASESLMDLELTEDSEASKYTTAMPTGLSNLKFVDSSLENKKKELKTGNLTGSVGTLVPQTPAIVDLNLNVPGNSIPSGYSTCVCAPSLIPSNGPSNDNAKMTQKESHGHLSWNSTVYGTSASPADPLKHLNLQPSRAVEASVSHYSTLDGDRSKQLPSVIRNLTAHLQDNCPINEQLIGADGSDVLPPRGFDQVNPFKWSCRSVGRIFHMGVRCDGCGVHPITGPRFKSQVKENYDLCSICFSEMGNEAEYIRMDRPASFRSPRLNKFRNPRSQISSPPHVLQGCRMKSGRPKLDSLFIQDVNVVDGTVMAPATPFTKIWRMRNNGTMAWPRGTQLVWTGGAKFSNRISVEVEIPEDCFPVGKELDIAVNFTTPELPGQYISYWRMALPSGQKFGQHICVLIQVDTFLNLQGSLSDSSHGLNLNLPPESSGAKGQEIIDVNVEPVDGSLPESGNSNSAAEFIKPLVNELPSNDRELEFPVNDGLLVGVGASVPVPPKVPASVSHPITYPSVFLSEPYPITEVPTISDEINRSDAVEQILLKELEHMGFKQMELNKEILRMNDYNLDQSVDDLCGVVEWDPILEELQEMGFCDQETNKKLLAKNGGSIKRVVLDLITREKVE
ncbi:hypothetical protein HHK36_029563 [Tetracentron sinense]|uniref:Protein NBR1 homolog n=1 Tax=Tetracentron sinense TaxID=13715 RepID=A0A834YBW4_TETSI|nr:hypothetical protein HHK36_029563 [Tetracentron sinense]